MQAREERTGPGRNSNWYDPANKSAFQPKPRAVRNKNMLNFKRVGTKEAEQALQLKMKETRSTMYKEQLRVTRSEATKKLNAEARKQSKQQQVDASLQEARDKADFGAKNMKGQMHRENGTGQEKSIETSSEDESSEDESSEIESSGDESARQELRETRINLRNERYVGHANPLSEDEQDDQQDAESCGYSNASSADEEDDQEDAESCGYSNAPSEDDENGQEDHEDQQVAEHKEEEDEHVHEAPDGDVPDEGSEKEEESGQTL